MYKHFTIALFWLISFVIAGPTGIRLIRWCVCARVFFFLFFSSLVGSFCLLVFRGVCAFLYNINFCVSIHFSNEDYWRHTFKHLKYSNTWQLIKNFDMQPSKVDLRLRLRLYQTLTELIELNWSKTRVLIIIIIKLYSIWTRQTQPSHCLLSIFLWRVRVLCSLV